MYFFHAISAWWQSRAHTKELFYIVEPIDWKILNNYHQSLGWYLETLTEEGKIPTQLIHISTIGKTENKIWIVYDDRQINQTQIEKILTDLGLKIINLVKKK